MSFLNELHTNTNKTARTANGALSNASTLNPVLDFFSKAGAMRGRETEAFKFFQKAFDADPQSAIRVLFYLRDIRGGQGERSVFKYILNQLDEDFANRIVQYIPEYGRWDEVPINKTTAEMIAFQLGKDMEDMKAGKSVSLLAKWMPSENAGKQAMKNARKLAKLLGWVGEPSETVVSMDKAGKTIKQVTEVPNLRTYRKNVVALRKYINLLEQKMSTNNWEDIDFSKIPSQAHKKHVKAFFRHQEERYKAYLESVEKGEAKINAQTLFTYDLYQMVQRSGEAGAADALWKNLPDYTRGTNALVLPDVSGSMYGLPISISVSLALYFAERNKGPFKNYFLSFSDEPKLHKVTGSTLSTRLRSVQSATNHMGSTNLQGAFDQILKAAQASNAKSEDMPATLYVISDMQFNSACRNNNKTNLEVIKEKYKAAGYEMPHVVFWNCNAFGNDSPATMYDDNVTLISGSSQSTFQYVVEGKTPMQSMLDILNSERYNKIVL
jgi:hypothetical protein